MLLPGNQNRNKGPTDIMKKIKWRLTYRPATHKVAHSYNLCCFYAQILRQPRIRNDSRIILHIKETPHWHIQKKRQINAKSKVSPLQLQGQFVREDLLYLHDDLHTLDQILLYQASSQSYKLVIHQPGPVTHTRKLVIQQLKLNPSIT